MNSVIANPCVVLSIAYDPVKKDYVLSSIYKNGKDLLPVDRSEKLHEIISGIAKTVEPPNWIEEFLAHD